MKALDWDGVELVTSSEVDDSITSVGIRAHDFEPLSDSEAEAYRNQEAANLIPVQNAEVSEMPFEWYVMLQNGIWWKIGKAIHVHDKKEIIPQWLRVKPSAILLLGGGTGEK